VTCRLVHEEARPTLQRKVEHCKAQPVRYLVDYSAARALVSPSSALRGCLGVADGRESKRENEVVQAFFHLCRVAVSSTRRTRSGVRAIEMTITHMSEVVYDREFLETMMVLGMLTYYSLTRLAVVYKIPLPRIQIRGEAQARDSSDLERQLLHEIPREPNVKR
jgi:hypothetical protein